MVIRGITFLLFLLTPLSSSTGALLVQSEQGAEVVWEGVPLGRTDRRGILHVSDIPPGRFTVVLRKDGYKEAHWAVEVTRGETATLQVPLEQVAVAKRLTGDHREAGGDKSAIPASQSSEARDACELPVESGTRDAVLLPRSARSSLEENEPTFSALFPTFVVAFLLLSAVFLLVRRFWGRSSSQSDVRLAEPGRRVAEAFSTRTGSFLEDLKQREELLEQGKEESRARRPGPVIDLDSSDVRKVVEP